MDDSDSQISSPDSFYTDPNYPMDSYVSSRVHRIIYSTFQSISAPRGCTRDEGRSLQVYLQKQTTNHPWTAKQGLFGGPHMREDLICYGRDIPVESPRIGDAIAFLNSGSYGFTSSPLFFLGHETPLELLAAGNVIKVIRKVKNLIDFN